VAGGVSRSGAEDHQTSLQSVLSRRDVVPTPGDHT
jgi:hypothetical protein